MLASCFFEKTIEKIYLEGKTPVFNMASGGRCSVSQKAE